MADSGGGRRGRTPLPRVAGTGAAYGSDGAVGDQAAHHALGRGLGVAGAPGLGDDIQAMKSGLLEIADILVVNKAEGMNRDVVAAEFHELGCGEPRDVASAVIFLASDASKSVR